MLPDFTFKATPHLIFGSGKLRELPALLRHYGSHLLIVVGGHSFLSGKEWPKIHELLESQGFSFDTVQISGEPSPEDINTLSTRYSSQTIDTVVAIGGGSVLDAGKAISAMFIEQQPVETFLEGVGTRKPSGRKVPFIAIPTTSGTGSEATSNAVISKVGENGFKKSLRHDNYVPDIALLDPILTLGCPAPLTVACGMDTFTQLVEAYLSTHSSPLSDTLALEGIRYVIHSLKRVCHDGNDLEARCEMSYASYLSGLVLANAGLGVVHGFASAIGGYFPIPHGVVCGTLMAAANRITLQKLRETGENEAALRKYSILGKLVHKNNISDQDSQDMFIRYLEDLTTGLGIASLGDFGITGRDIERIISQSGNKYNPAPLNHSELTAVLQARIA